MGTIPKLCPNLQAPPQILPYLLQSALYPRGPTHNRDLHAVPHHNPPKPVPHRRYSEKVVPGCNSNPHHPVSKL